MPLYCRIDIVTFQRIYITFCNILPHYASFVIFIIQMFDSSQKSVEQKPLKDANFLSVYVYVHKCMFVRICLHTSRGRCAKTEPSSYGSCETKNKQCGSCILTTKHVTQTNYYDILI